MIAMHPHLMLTTGVEQARRAVLEELRPPRRLPLSEWIEANVRLPEGVSAVPGPVRLWQFQRGIADAMGSPELERVTVVKSVRVGLTSLMTGALANYVSNEPSPIMLLLPTEADARDYVVSDLEPIFDASPSLRGLLSDEADESGRNTLTSRRFAGGSLKVIAAKAPRNLRRHNIRVMIADEIDAMEPGAEGNPLTLAERRTLSFANRRIIAGSTPTIEETSNVLRLYGASDQRVFEVPCPACGTFSEIMWQHIEWEPDRPETAAYRCPHCRDLIEERHKPAMVAQGRWRITRPEVTGHAGFRINALVSGLANAAWRRLATEFLAAKDDPATLQVFVNTILGQGWREAAEEVSETELQTRAEPFGLDAIPPEVIAVTAGVDIQDDRAEVSLIGWTKTGEMLVLAHLIVWGSPDDHGTWAELDALLRSRWQHPHGGSLRIDAAIIDSGDGDWTQAVYNFAFPRLARRILAGKGMAGARPVL
jgi:phage terminase large subunit GpA-like protein